MTDRMFTIAFWAIPAVIPVGIAALIGSMQLNTNTIIALCATPPIAWMAMALGRRLALR